MRILEPEGVERGGQSAVRCVVRNGNQTRLQRSVGIVMSQSGVRPSVHLTHPAPANNADAQGRRLLADVDHYSVTPCLRMPLCLAATERQSTGAAPEWRWQSRLLDPRFEKSALVGKSALADPVRG